QRPVFDWIGASAPSHVLRAGQKMTLAGYGREVAGTEIPLRYDEISSAAITHRYDLLYANPDRPWLAATDDAPPSGIAPAGPAADPCASYTCLPAEVGAINPTSGQVKAGKGNHPRVYAIGLLSVGDQSASYPLAFEPKAAFKPKQPKPL